MVIKKIRGVIVPVIVPFKKDGAVDYDKFNRNIEKWNEDDLGGYLILGSNSEAVLLNREEKLKLVEEAVQTADRNKLIMVGTGFESTLETIHFNNQVAGVGVDASLVITPAFYKDQLQDENLIRHYQKVADQSEVPVIIYNVPKFTQVNISIEAVSELAKHPNIIGIKDSSSDVSRMVSMKNAVDEHFNIIAGTASIWMPALTIGVEAGIMALANCAPNECTGIQEAFEKGNLKEARDIYLKIHPVNHAVTTKYGVAGLKYAADLIGYEGGEVREPLLPLNDMAKEDLRRILSIAQLFQE